MDHRSLGSNYDISRITTVTVPFREDMDFEFVPVHEDDANNEAGSLPDHQLYSPVQSVIVTEKFIDLNDENMLAPTLLESSSRKRKWSCTQFDESRIVESSEERVEGPRFYRVRGVGNLSAPKIIGIPFRFGPGITYSGDISRLCRNTQITEHMPSEIYADDPHSNIIDCENINKDSPLYCNEELGYLSPNESSCDYDPVRNNDNSPIIFDMKRKQSSSEELE